MDGLDIRQKNSVVDLTELVNAQIELDKTVFKNAEVTREDTKTKRTIALIGEIVEVADEIPHWWKYWKKKLNPINDGALVEELADVLHFILSKGIDGNAECVHNKIIYYETPQRQLEALMRWATLADASKSNWVHLMGVYRGLIDALGISWLAMETAYYMKNKENTDRQANGY